MLQLITRRRKEEGEGARETTHVGDALRWTMPTRHFPFHNFSSLLFYLPC